MKVQTGIEESSLRSPWSTAHQSEQLDQGAPEDQKAARNWSKGWELLIHPFDLAFGAIHMGRSWYAPNWYLSALVQNDWTLIGFVHSLLSPDVHNTTNFGVMIGALPLTTSNTPTLFGNQS